MVFRDDGAVLLVQRGRPPLEGGWSLPGGKVRAGERLEDAVRRELLEETGLAVVPVACVAVVNLAGEGYAYEIHDFVARLAPGSRADDARAGDDARALAWWPEARLDEAPLTDEVRRVIALARARVRPVSGPRA